MPLSMLTMINFVVIRKWASNFHSFVLNISTVWHANDQSFTQFDCGNDRNVGAMNQTKMDSFGCTAQPKSLSHVSIAIIYLQSSLIYHPIWMQPFGRIDLANAMKMISFHIVWCIDRTFEGNWIFLIVNFQWIVNELFALWLAVGGIELESNDILNVW